jgi:hypothetical protein
MLPARFGTLIQINGDGSEMLDWVPHDPAITEFVWQLGLLFWQIITGAFHGFAFCSMGIAEMAEIDDGVAHRRAEAEVR